MHLIQAFLIVYFILNVCLSLIVIVFLAQENNNSHRYWYFMLALQILLNTLSLVSSCLKRLLIQCSVLLAAHMMISIVLSLAHESLPISFFFVIQLIPITILYVLYRNIKSEREQRMRKAFEASNLDKYNYIYKKNFNVDPFPTVSALVNQI